MKSTIKYSIALIAFLTFSYETVLAQIHQSRSAIVKEYGYDYSEGVTNDGTKYISYKKDMKTIPSGSYTRTKAYYFTKLDDGTEICYLWKIIEPSSETNTNVAGYKSKLVELGYMQWKDYETNIIYEIEVKDGLCITTAWWDNKK